VRAASRAATEGREGAGRGTLLGKVFICFVCPAHAVGR
jgi:hypothetical protein